MAAGATHISLLLPLAKHQAAGAPPQTHWHRAGVCCANWAWKHANIRHAWCSTFIGWYSILCFLWIYTIHRNVSSSHCFLSKLISSGTECECIDTTLWPVALNQIWEQRLCIKMCNFSIDPFLVSISMVLSGKTLHGWEYTLKHLAPYITITPCQQKYSGRHGVSKTRCFQYTTANWALRNKLLTIWANKRHSKDSKQVSRAA